MNRVSILIFFFFQLSLYQCINGQVDREEYTMIQRPKHSVILKAPKSIGNFFRRFFPGKNNKDSQSMAPPGSPIPQQLGGPMYGAMGPMPMVPPFGPGGGAPSQFLPPYGSYASASFPSPVTMPPPSMAFGGQPYAMPPPGGIMHPHSPYGDQMAPPPHPSSPDFHSVLDTFVRNTGLTPAGSNPVPEVSPSKGGDTDTPVFSFKKLYSFPFYLSTDSSGPSLSIPYMRQHVARRRMMAPLGSKVDFDIRSQSLHPHPLDPSRHPSLPSHPHPLVPRHPSIPHHPSIPQHPMAPSMQHKLMQNPPIGSGFPNLAPSSELHSVYHQQQQLLKALHSNDLITRYLQQAMKDTKDEDEGGKKQRKDLSSSSSPSSSFSHQGKGLMIEGIDEEEILKKKKSSSSYSPSSSSSYSPSSSSLASLLLSSASEDGNDSDESSSSSPKDILSRDRLRDHRYITTTFLDKDDRDRDERSKSSSPSSSSRHHSTSEDHPRFNSPHPHRNHNGNDGIIDDNDVDMLPNESTRVVQLTSSYSMAGNLGSGINGISIGQGDASSRTVNGITVTDHGPFVRRGTVH